MLQVARKLTHYIAPDVCDEVAHCMHQFKKDMKHSLANRIVGAIEDNIKKAFEEHAVLVNGENGEATASVDGAKAKRGRLFYVLHFNVCVAAFFGVRTNISDILHIFLCKYKKKFTMCATSN